jgi:hypothetical protein
MACRVGAVVLSAVLIAGGVSAALATEPGWPESHQPAADPGPGQAAALAQVPADVPAAQELTDDQLRAKDPAGYRLVTGGRAALERELLRKVRGRLKQAGVPVGAGRQLTAAELDRATVTLAASPWSPYGYLKFRLTPSTSPYARNGYLGTLYFTYGIYSAASDSYKWFTVSWPARSGNNRPADQAKVNVGPIPEYRWTFGFLYGAWRGYEADARESFYPGKWRLDPWTGGPYGRGYMEVHGGIGTHEYGATSGCIRLYSKHLPQLKTYYDSKMANKKDASTAILTVDY